MRNTKKYREFEGGYIPVKDLGAIFEAHKLGHLSKKELRIWFASLEAGEAKRPGLTNYLLNHKSEADLEKEYKEGYKKRSISHEDQARGITKFERLTVLFKPKKELTTKIPRKFARTCARGILSRSQMVAGLAYFFMRMPQRKLRSALRRGERYARFTYQKLHNLTGLAISTLSLAFGFLCKHALIAIAWRPMSEIKKFGRLYVDGLKTNLFCFSHGEERVRNPYKKTKIKTHLANNQKSNNITLPNNSFNLLEEFLKKKNNQKLVKMTI